MKERIIYIILSILISSQLNGQIATDYGTPIKWDRYNRVSKYVMSGIDTLSNDSILIERERYIRKNKDGKLLEELNYSKLSPHISCDDEGPKLTGYWKSYYPTGKIKEIGKIVCNKKFGEWIYFYESGSIEKFENYDELDIIYSNPNVAYLNGSYLEYHPNGNIKVSGTYKIIEENSVVYIFNPETYQEETKCCEWKPKSVKIGKWSTYDQNGKMIESEVYELTVKDSVNLREIAARYLEININEIQK